MQENKLKGWWIALWCRLYPSWHSVCLCMNSFQQYFGRGDSTNHKIQNMLAKLKKKKPWNPCFKLPLHAEDLDVQTTLWLFAILCVNREYLENLPNSYLMNLNINFMLNSKLFQSIDNPSFRILSEDSSGLIRTITLFWKVGQMFLKRKFSSF